MLASDREFEGEIRRTARLLWPAAQFDGASIHGGENGPDYRPL